MIMRVGRVGKRARKPTEPVGGGEDHCRLRRHGLAKKALYGPLKLALSPWPARSFGYMFGLKTIRPALESKGIATDAEFPDFSESNSRFGTANSRLRELREFTCKELIYRSF